MKKLISGKVRDVYEVSNDRLVIVTTDRISAFDVILSKPVKGKGKVLNKISLFWFNYTKDIIPNHVISGDLKDMPEYFQNSEFDGRTVLAKKLNILPFEFVVRGYMFGHLWEAYRNGRKFCGEMIDGNYKLAEKLEVPIFTPSTKVHTGHDEYISVRDVADTIGYVNTKIIKETCMKLYETCNKYAKSKGIIIADTKFEFGTDAKGNLFLADEIFTPDSSRFWSIADYQTGISPKSYDKQFVRDWLENNKVNGEMQFDNVPECILEKTSDIYSDCLRKIVG